MIFRNKRQFVYFGMDSFGDRSDDLVSKAASAEKRIQERLQKDAQAEAAAQAQGVEDEQEGMSRPIEQSEVKSGAPEQVAEQTAAQDIIDEKQLATALNTMNTMIQESPVSDEYKGVMQKALADLMDGKSEEFRGIDGTSQKDLVDLHAKVLGEIQNFTQQEDVKLATDTVQLFQDNANDVKATIDLKTYKKGSEHYKVIGTELEAVGITEEVIKNLQTIQGLKVDGKCGPKTINAISQMLDLGVQTEVGDETLYEGAEESVETTQRRTDIEAGLIPPEAREQIDAAMDRIYAKEKVMGEKAQNYMNNLMANGESAPGHEDDMVKYLESFKDLLNAMGVIVDVKERTGLTEISQESEVLVSTFAADPDKHGGVALASQYIPIPSNMKEHMALQKNVDSTIDATSRALYLKSGNPKLKDGYDKAQDKMTAQVRSDTDAMMKDPSLSDGVEDPDNPDRIKVRDALLTAKDNIITEFDAFTRLQASDPVACHKQAVAFQVKLAKLTEGDGGDYNLDFSQTTKFPNLHTTFMQIAIKLENAAGSVAINAIQNNPDVNQYTNDYKLYVQRSQPIIRSVARLQEQLDQGVEMPSEHFMDVLHEGARELLNSPLRLRLQNNGTVQKLAALKFEDTTGKKFSKLNIVLDDLKTNVSVTNKGLEDVRVLAASVLKMEGSTSKASTMLKETAVFTAVVAGAVAGTVLTGGMAGGPIATFVGGAIAGGAGATILGQGTKAILKNDASHFSPKELGKAMAWNTLFSVGIGVAGVGVKAVVGKTAGTFLAQDVGQALKGVTAGVGKVVPQGMKNVGIAVSKKIGGKVMHKAIHTVEHTIKDTGEKFAEKQVHHLAHHLTHAAEGAHKSGVGKLLANMERTLAKAGEGTKAVGETYAGGETQGAIEGGDKPLAANVLVAKLLPKTDAGMKKFASSGQLNLGPDIKGVAQDDGGLDLTYTQGKMDSVIAMFTKLGMPQGHLQELQRTGKLKVNQGGLSVNVASA
ncbi:MAG: peptidoglycan-binding domain-containing protein [bacterium]|nr:peptidoglycan-binding domain-containing protein [bacterium]